MPVLGQIWLFFGPKSIFGGEGVKPLVPSYQGTMRHLFCIENIDRRGTNWPLGAKMCFFDPKIWIFGAKSHFFLYGNRDLCQQGISPVCLGLQFSHSDHPEKISVSELTVIYQGSPLFLAVSGHSPITSISILNFGPFSTKLGGTVWAIKKMTQNDNGPSPDRNYGETAVFRFSRFPELQPFS